MEALEIVLANRFGVGDYGGTAPSRQPLGKQVPATGEGVPLFAAALDAIDIEHGGHTGETRPERKDGVGGVAVEDGIEAAE